VHADIYQTIRDRILFMEYPPGRILNEKVLAEEFGVSRTPLREVLYRLEWEKLVRIIPRTGTMVTEIEFPKIKNAFQVRFELEGLVGRLAADRISDEQIQQLESLREECASLFPNKSPKDLVDIDFKLRAIVYEAANNVMLQDISDYLYNITVRVWYMVVNKVNWADEVQGLLDEIEATIEAFSKRDPEEVAQVRKGYLIKFVDRIKDLF